MIGVVLINSAFIGFFSKYIYAFIVIFVKIFLNNASPNVETINRVDIY